ncbi:hypothetical protein PF010_g4185 [Phytophthora fragariae]|uniref:Uncharacterized protein n=1 Tax=Phytophthora fragariae TaxID=53985 RepID=A0A6G0LSX2_9STRA|nr:hypothetical protein PF010_g4185 [Phytophthora fragariae]
MDEVSAALADVQARQQSLAHGAVLPRSSAPPAAARDAAAAPPPAAKSKPRPPAFQWLKRRVVRRSERKDSALEDLGSLELVPSASLATARTLVGQFIALPPHREFQFVHPTTNARVAAAQEKDVLAADWPFLCIALLPLREAAATGDAAAREQQQRRQRPETARPQQPQQQMKPPPWTPGIGAATRPRTAAAAAVAPQKRASPEVRELQTVLVRTKDMKKDATVDSKGEMVPLEEVEAQTVDGEVAGQLKPNRFQVKSTGVNSTVASVPRGRRAVTHLPSEDSTNATGSSSAASSEAESTSPTVGDAKGMKEGEAHVLDAVPVSSAQDYQGETHGDDSQETTSSDAVTLESVHETPSLPEKLTSQTPGHLRRSRRFKALTAANIAEKSWGSEQLEQQQVVSDEQVEELVISLVEIFRTGMTEVDTRQLDAALWYYGIDYRALELNGLLLALDAELGTRCNHVQNGVDGQLMQVLLKIFPVEREHGIDLEALQRFEYALNLFAGMRGWKSPTKLRACCFEDRQPLQLIPVTDSRRLSLLRLSDKDRQLFSLASSNNSTAGIEKWLADGLEVTYILLYGFLQSRRNAGPKSLAKLDNLHMRQDRIQAAIQKLSSFSFDVWKRLEFRTTDVEDVFMVKRLNELVSGFLRDANLYSRELDGTVFFPAIVGYLTRKSEQLAQSLSGLLVSSRGSRESLHNTVKEYLSSLRQQLEQHKLHSASPDIYLSNIGLKIVDVDKINASRSSAGLGRIYMNGKESILTHHQCKLMARDKSLRVRGRWEQQELNKGEVTRYFFVGPKDVALEYIYLRAKAAPSGGDEMHWEDYEAFAKKEAHHAFAFFCSSSTVVPMNVAIGIGINIAHSDLLPHLCSLLSLSVVLREYSDATSVSFGYCYEPVIQATRVVFRVHTEMSAGNQSYDRGAGVWWGLPSAIRRAGQFLMSAQEEEVIAFCKAKGLKFLHSLLEGRGLPWHFVKYGQAFSEYILGTCGRDPECLREDVLRAIQATITMFPRAPQCFTKTNIQIVVQLLEMLPDTSDIGDDAVNVLQAVCSNVQKHKIPGAFSAAMMTEPQKTFATQCGLGILVNATTRLQHLPARKESVECAIVALLMTLEVATELEKLEVDEVLLSLLENESAAVSILASRAYVVLLFQGLLSRRIIDEYRLKRLCNLLTTILASGSRLALSPKRSSSDPETPEAIQFAANMQDSFSILHRYRTMNIEQQVHARQKELDQEDAPLEGREVIWEPTEWNDPNRAVAEKLATHLKILVVLSSMTKNVVSIGGSDELREIILLLVRFDRERLHNTSYHTTLYLLSLRNILWATRSDVAKWGISELMEASFLRKLLLLAKDKVFQELASGILWGLADAYEKSNTFILSFEVDDTMATGSYFTKKKGFAVMVDNLALKLASGRSVENDAGALASMIASPASSSFFLTKYGYPFVLKLIESMLRLVRAGYTIDPKEEEPAQNAGEVFGTALFYLYPIKHRIERELFQLCRAAANALEAMQRINPESVLDEAARTKLTMLQLLDYPNKQIACFAVSCCSIHLQTHPTSTKLLEADVQDKVIAFFFDDDYPPIQIAAFSCMKLAFADQKNFAGLQLKLSPFIERIVACLRSPNFEVKRKVILFLVEAVFRLDDQNFLDGVADAFGSQNNKELIMELFESVSREIVGNPSAGSVLQLLVRLILKLDLVHTGGDQLVDVICLTLKAHSNDTFLRPMLFNFLHQIVTQGDRVNYLERRSRLDVIIELLSQQLTQNELRNVANMLFLAANNHAGIRHYLSEFTSKCIPKIVSVMDGFSEYVQDDDASKILQHQSKGEVTNSEGNPNEEQTTQVPDAGAANYYLKVTTAKTVFISYFIEDIYEQFLRLLLLLVTGSEFCSEERYGCPCEGEGCSNCDPCDIVAKALCGHVILRLSTADRILCSSYDTSYLISAKGDPATSVLHLSIRILEILAANHQSRGQLLRGSVALDWSWIPLLTRSAILCGRRADDADVDDTSRTAASTAAQTIQMFGHLSAAKELALRLAAEKPFIAMLFSYLDPTDMLFTSDVEVRRASSFTLARLAEYPLIVRDTFFQEKMAMLAYAALDYGELQVSSAEHDPLVLSNKMILTRNRALLTPGLQGRSADDDMLSLLMRLLLSDEVDSNDVGALCADVLAHVLYFRVNARDEKRLRSVMWHYTRAMSPKITAIEFR